MKLQRAETINQRIHTFADVVGKLLVDAFHYLALFAIGGAIAWSAAVAFFAMAEKGHTTIDDILLLFIYLELGAMIGIYFKTNHMPVRFLIYVGITGLTRLLVGDIAIHHTLDWGIVMVSGSILLLAFANLVVRYGSARFPSARADDLR